MDSKRKIKMSEFKQNNGENGNKLWVLIDNKVYDLTDFSHPGGNEILMDDHGSDRIDEFESIHSPAAKKQMVKYLIGEIDLSKDEGEVENKNVNKQAYTDKKTDEVKVQDSSSSIGILVLVFISIIVAFVLYKNVLNKK